MNEELTSKNVFNEAQKKLTSLELDNMFLPFVYGWMSDRMLPRDLEGFKEEIVSIVKRREKKD
jgi:hypothetical protein